MTLAEARKRAGLSQKAVADELGITDAAVAQWETGKSHPRFHRLKQLAELYRVSITELVEG